MNIRVKTVLILVMICAGVAGSLYITSQIILLNSFARIEEKETVENSQRVLKAVNSEISNLDTINLNGWAAWNDTYEFIVDNNTAYIASNLGDLSFQQGGFNCMLFIDRTGQLVYGKAVDLQNGTQIQLPPDLLNLVGSNPVLWNFSSTSSYVRGIILLAEDPMIISSRPILTSDGLGPGRGALIMGEYLTPEKLSEFSTQVQLPLTLEAIDNPVLPPDFQLARSSLTEQNQIWTNPLNESTVAGYALLNDVFNNPILIIRADMPRDVYSQGQITINYFILSSFLWTVVFVGIIMLLLETTVLSRLTNLSKKVSSVGKIEQTSVRMPTQGNDEISRLAESINGMLTEIENKTIQLKKTERLAAIGELAAMVGHDLRNPLTGIANANYYIKVKHGQKMDEKGTAMLKIIDDAIKYSNKIISDLLEYSREVKPDVIQTTPNHILKQTLSSMEIPTKIKVIDKTQDMPKIKVDPTKVQRVFQNIIKNAFDAMPNGGELTIKIAQLNDTAQISFTDTGIGMTQEILSKIWTPLFTTKAKGMGFGLAICRRIVEAHNGQISIESEVNKGSTITVILPIDPKIKESEEAFVNLPEKVLAHTKE